ncbi:hypothetical protein [Streptomyces sp. NPDC051016]|uniref:hypothetical protein n=1 Tax=Streptomyces sp. NPDC051016 TaxID=3365638 RepID=UPI0037B6D533
MSVVATALTVYGIASAATCSLFVPRAVRAWRATRPPLADRVADAQARTGVTAQELDDAAFVRHIQTELKDYGTAVADYYDKGAS